MTESCAPHANAVAERVNGILKQEFGLGGGYAAGLDVARQVVTESVDAYNTMRPHLCCAMLTPQQMHSQRKVKLKTHKNKVPGAAAPGT